MQTTLKKISFLTVLALLTLLNHGKSQIRIISSGNVAIGNTTPDSYKLRIQGLTKITPGTSGTIIIDNSGYSNSPAIYGGATLGKPNQSFYDMYSYHYYGPSSDSRLKENIRPLTNSLELILQLNGVKYDYIRGPFVHNWIMGAGISEEMVDSARKNYVGFIAQDVKKVIPAVVGYDDSTDIYSIDYTKFTPYLVEAIKEQQIIIESLQAEIESLRSEISGKSTLKSASISTSIDILATDKKNTLYQNSPNPFNESTAIKYFVSSIMNNAMINIYDLQGKQIESFSLTQKGQGEIKIAASSLIPGIYIYNLIVDGREVASKRMILTD